MTNVPSDIWTATATVENVPKLRRQAVGYAREHNVEDPPIGDLALALGEAITNAVIHAFRHREPGTITVALTIEPSANVVTAVVRDNGIGFQPNPESPGLGFGMPLIETVADSIEVRTPEDGRGTEVQMTFHMPVDGA
jgi:serine/threonine-protein kinase RsbW/stage II sporulation protein AB (anti-sigma F factor)